MPLFHDAFPTSMGAVPSAVLAEPGRLRSRHPQASVAALGAAVLLGVGHNRNSFLHHAESLVPGHRTKLRRFPYVVERNGSGSKRRTSATTTTRTSRE